MLLSYEKMYNRIYLIRNEREFHIYSFEDGERFEPDYVLFLQRDKTDGFEQLQIFIEPKGTQLLEKDAWKKKFLLQLGRRLCQPPSLWTTTTTRFGAPLLFNQTPQRRIWGWGLGV